MESAVAADVRRARIDASFSRVSPVVAVRQLLWGRTHALRYGPSGIQEIVVQADGKTGYLELSAPGRTTPPGTPVPWSPPERPADDPVKVAALRRTALDAADAGARREALEELADIRDAGLLVDTLVQMLARERETNVLMTVLDVASQQKGRIPPEALRAFAASDRDGSVRAEALELLVAHDGVEPAARALLRTLAGSDGSRHVREEAARILATLERPPASRAPGAPP